MVKKEVFKWIINITFQTCMQYVCVWCGVVYLCIYKVWAVSVFLSLYACAQYERRGFWRVRIYLLQISTQNEHRKVGCAYPFDVIKE